MIRGKPEPVPRQVPKYCIWYYYHESQLLRGLPVTPRAPAELHGLLFSLSILKMEKSYSITPYMVLTPMTLLLISHQSKLIGTLPGKGLHPHPLNQTE